MSYGRSDRSPARRRKNRCQQQPGENRIDAVLTEKIRAIGAQNEKRRMGNLRHVEQAERHRQTDADRRIKTAEHYAGDQGFGKEIELHEKPYAPAFNWALD